MLHIDQQMVWVALVIITWKVVMISSLHQVNCQQQTVQPSSLSLSSMQLNGQSQWILEPEPYPIRDQPYPFYFGGYIHSSIGSYPSSFDAFLAPYSYGPIIGDRSRSYVAVRRQQQIAAATAAATRRRRRLLRRRSWRRTLRRPARGATQLQPFSSSSPKFLGMATGARAQRLLQYGRWVTPGSRSGIMSTTMGLPVYRGTRRDGSRAESRRSTAHHTAD
jgi:hypothetical protein